MKYDNKKPTVWARKEGFMKYIKTLLLAILAGIAIGIGGTIYLTLENKIIPAYYNKDKNGMSAEWLKLMKNSIISTGGRFSTSRMVVDYTEKFYMPLCDLTNNYFSKLDVVTEYKAWKEKMYLLVKLDIW